MAGKKKIELFVEINNQKEFDQALEQNKDTIICAEIYSKFAGSCTAMDRLVTKIKFDLTSNQMIFLKVPSDEIAELERFRNQSKPVYMFITKKKVMRVYRGVNSVGLEEIATTEYRYLCQSRKGVSDTRPAFPLDQATPDEMAWIQSRADESNKELSNQAVRRAERQAERKKHRAELMVPHLKEYNFILFWPHATHAHPELYERWDAHDIIMVGRETIQLEEEQALDVLYAGDAPVNEASMQKLLSGKALVICFKCLEDKVDFVPLVRRILYEEIPPYDESKAAKDQLPRETAFDHYKTFSPTREHIWQLRRDERTKKRENLLHQRARRLSEIRRLATEAFKEAVDTKKKAREEMKMQLLRSGNLQALDELNERADDEDVDIVIPEKLDDPTPEESEDDEDENEYFPPADLLIPGFYAPPNEIAKCNGLAILFPKLVGEQVTPIPEFLPPHVVVMLHLGKRYKALDIVSKNQPLLIHMGIFKCTTPYDANLIAYTVKQYDVMKIMEHIDSLRLVFVISIKVDVLLLELMDLYPMYVSRDASTGEDDHAALFPVNYGLGYPVHEDFDVIEETVEEEAVEEKEEKEEEGDNTED